MDVSPIRGCVECLGTNLNLVVNVGPDLEAADITCTQGTLDSATLRLEDARGGRFPKGAVIIVDVVRLSQKTHPRLAFTCLVKLIKLKISVGTNILSLSSECILAIVAHKPQISCLSEELGFVKLDRARKAFVATWRIWVFNLCPQHQEMR